MGTHGAKVRAMIDYEGKNVDEAFPSMPVEILGMNSSAFAGAEFIVTKMKTKLKRWLNTKKTIQK